MTAADIDTAITDWNTTTKTKNIIPQKYSSYGIFLKYSVFSCVLTTLVLVIGSLEAQTTTPTTATSVETRRDAFRNNLLKAAVSAQKKGEIKRTDVLRLRVALYSPTFQRKVEDLAVLQMSFSGDDGPFETSNTGEIIRETIDWEKLLVFLEKLIPIILTLIAAFGA